MNHQLFTQQIINCIAEYQHTYNILTTIVLQPTRKGFEGEYTFVCFAAAKATQQSPVSIGQAIGDYLKSNLSLLVKDYNIVQGFLNIQLHDSVWVSTLLEDTLAIKTKEILPTVICIEYSSPNTNKPLHLGHIRNNLLGATLATMYEKVGHTVKRVNLCNDRGIHICKSMYAWQKFGEGATPASTGIKGDHLVGDYYVLFEQKLKAEIQELVEQGVEKEKALDKTKLMQAIRIMLQEWEMENPEIRATWELLNSWVYEGFETTYKDLGVWFDKTYYESQTYLFGKQCVQLGLEKNVFQKAEDNSVFIDLGTDGLDTKIVQRKDGTAVYMTQDIGTVIERHNELHASQYIHVVANEQNYHFKVLKLIIKHLGYDWWDTIYHFGYGMVELPTGRMKTREGTVVDADDIIADVIKTAETITSERSNIKDFSSQELQQLYRTIGLGALKYFILRIDPLKSMIYNPEEAISFDGNTAPFIQYSYARIQSILRKSTNEQTLDASTISLHPKEKALLQHLYVYGETIVEATEGKSPAIIAHYLYELAHLYNQFYFDCPILKEEDTNLQAFRLGLSSKTATILKDGLEILGIQVPDRM